jgi:hypothetical protein
MLFLRNRLSPEGRVVGPPLGPALRDSHPRTPPAAACDVIGGMEQCNHAGLRQLGVGVAAARNFIAALGGVISICPMRAVFIKWSAATTSYSHVFSMG